MSEDLGARDVATLLRLESCGGGNFRSPLNERNLNDRVYGGQVLGQLVWAAMSTVEPQRRPTMMQMVFLQGARFDDPIDYAVTALQDGKRFSSRQVLGSQHGRRVAQAHVSFQVPSTAPGHQCGPRGPVPSPEGLAGPRELHASLRTRLDLTGYGAAAGASPIDTRFLDAEQELFPSAPGTPLRFWLRIAQPLPAGDARLHAAALAYLSDWWLNYTSLAPYVSQGGPPTYYVASLNHSIWFHAPCRADEWLLCIAQSSWAGAGRGLSTAQIYAEDGRLVASTAQESLQIAKDAVS